MVASIGAVASPSQGVAYYERDGYYAKDDPAHREASAWAGKGAAALGLYGTVDPGVFTQILEGRVPDGTGRRLGRRGKDGSVSHRPGRDVTFSAPKSVSLMALVGGDARIVAAHDRAVKRTLAWVERNAAETRLSDPDSRRMVRAKGQKIVAATFRHETSRNLDPQLHTHAVLANMLLGADGKWRAMANERLYRSQKLIGMIYRSELAEGLSVLGYGIEKSHADGRFEIAGVPRKVIEAFSTRRAEIQKAMYERGLGDPAESPRLAERAALMTRSHKRDVDKDVLREHWKRQAAAMAFEPGNVIGDAREAAQKTFSTEAVVGEPERAPDASPGHERTAGEGPAPALAPKRFENGRGTEAVQWAAAHLSEREAVFSRTDLLTAALAQGPGSVSVEAAERAIGVLEDEGRLHRAEALEAGDGMTTDLALADERENIELMQSGRGRGKRIMRSWIVQARLHRGPLTDGQKAAVKLILSSKDRTIGIQGYAGSGKTTMLRRARALAEKNGYRLIGLAPSASAVKTLAAEAGIDSETLQRFLARNAGVAEGRLTRKGQKALRGAFSRSVLVVDEASLASTVQMKSLLRIASVLRLPRVVLVGDEKQLDAVDAGKAFAQLQGAGMQTATMDEIMRQRNPDLKAAVEASLAGEIAKAFEKLGGNVAEVEPDNIAGAVAARWLKLSPAMRERTGVMAPSHVLRTAINDHIRERLAREGAIRGRAYRGERLVSRGYTRAEKGLAGNYSAGDVVSFHRLYKRLGVAKGDERRVADVDHKARTVWLEGPEGQRVAWEPGQVAGFRGGSEVYRTEDIELRAGDRIRWTKNNAELGLVNSRTAEVLAVENGRISFRLEDGRKLDLEERDPALRHLDHAWASTVHAFQGRTVDNVIAGMESGHPHLTTQKSFYVEISRARDRAVLVTDDAARLKEQLEQATGERISALEGIGGAGLEPAGSAESRGKSGEAPPDRAIETEPAPVARKGIDATKIVELRPSVPERKIEMEL
ncbi:MAG: relaxase domain-containing protein [Rhodospirillaceae bacterium]|nr:relaxase domain-containing protein [Rhodospirillaceae bacterium]